MRSFLVLPLLVVVALCYGPCDLLRPSYPLAESTNFDIHGSAADLVTTETTCSTGSYYQGVWYTFVVQAEGQLSVNTCETTWDTVLVMETGSCSSHSCLQSNDDYSGCGPENRGSYLIDVPVHRGDTYYVLLRPYSTGFTPGDYTLGVNFVASASEDICPFGYLVLSNTDVSYYFTGTTSEFIGTSSACSYGSNIMGVYYSFEPLVSGTLTVTTCGTDFDTVLYIQKGTTCNDKSCAGTDDDTDYCSNSNRDSYLSIDVDANVVYDILLFAYNNAPPSTSVGYVLTLDFEANTLQSSEEVCPERIDSYWYGDSVYGTIRNMDTLESDECWYGTYGKWYEFTPSYYKQADIYLCSDSYTSLYLVEGLCTSRDPYCDAVAYASYYEYTDYCQGYAAHLSYYVTGGSTYYILVSSYSSGVEYNLLSGDYVSWSEDSSSWWWWYSSSSSHHWWWSSWDSDDSTAFWVIFVSVACSLAMCLCCVGVLCFCIHLCRRRRCATKYQPVAVKVPEQPIIIATQPPVVVTPQQPPQQVPQPQPQAQPQPQPQAQPQAQPQLPQIIIPQQHLQQQQQQYMFVPYPYMYAATSGQPAQLYPAVN